LAGYSADLVELMILTGVALLFSCFSSPALSALLTFFVFIIGHFSADLKSLATQWEASPRAGCSDLFITFCQISRISASLRRQLTANA